MDYLQQFKDSFEYIPESNLYVIDGYIHEEYMYLALQDTFEWLLEDNLLDEFMDSNGYSSIYQVARHFAVYAEINKFMKDTIQLLSKKMKDENEDNYDFLLSNN